MKAADTGLFYFLRPSRRQEGLMMKKDGGNGDNLNMEVCFRIHNNGNNKNVGWMD